MATTTNHLLTDIDTLPWEMRHDHHVTKPYSKGAEVDNTQRYIDKEKLWPNKPSTKQ